MTLNALRRPVMPLMRLMMRKGLRNNEIYLVLLSAVIGAVVGLGVVLVDQSVQWMHSINFGLVTAHRLSEGIGLTPWKIIVMPALGGLIIAFSMWRLRKWRVSEIIDPVEANALYGGKMSLGDSFVLGYLAIISTGFGASVGLEAALTQMGSGFASRIGQILRLRRGDLRLLVGCGAAAAISAAFNAPLAGGFYAFELIIGSYVPSALAPVTAAALAAAVTARSLVGSEAMFTVHAGPLHIELQHYPVFILIGLLAALIGIVTMRGVTWVERRTKVAWIPGCLRTALGGLAVGLMGLVLPQVLGSGHGAVQQIMGAPGPLWLIPALLIAKILASAISVGSGFRGGLFSTSLFIGGLLGALMSALLSFGLPDFAIDRLALVLVGMGSVAAAVIGAPLTMIFLVLELTGDFPVSVAVMVGVVIASVIVRQRFGYSFSTWRFHVRGLPIRSGHDVGWVRDLTAGKLMARDVRTVPANMKLRELRRQFPLGGMRHIFIADAEGRYGGVVQTTQMHLPDFDAQQDWLVAQNFAFAEKAFLTQDQSVQSALDVFVDTESETLPVVSDPESRKIVGYLTEGYASRRYRQELERVRNEELGQSQLFSSV